MRDCHTKAKKNQTIKGKRGKGRIMSEGEGMWHQGQKNRNLEGKKKFESRKKGLEDRNLT
jgi:hypothetical protein